MTPARPSACSLWVELSDRQALGESLSSEEARYLSGHAATCEPCGAEAQVFGEVSALIEDPPRTAADVPPPERAGDRESWTRRPWFPARHRARAAVAALGLLAACAAGLIAGWRPQREPPRASSPNEMAARMSVTIGSVEVNGVPAGAGQPLAAGAVVRTHAGSACIAVRTGVRACLAPESGMRIVDVDGPDRRLEALVGKLSAELDPQPSGTSFTIATREGTSTAIGTAFSVEVPADGGQVVTRVLHGTVLVHPNHGEDRRVTAHSQSAMVGEVTALPDDVEAREIEVLQPARPTTSPEPAVARVTSTPPGAVLKVDDRMVGRTPVSVLLDPGEHQFEVSGAGAAVRDVVRLGAGEELDRTFALPSRPPAPPAATSPPAEPTVAHPSSARRAPPPKTAETLLRVARDRRAHGDASGAAAAYRELMTTYPRTAEAGAARVAYGELELGTLGDPAGALAAFDEYLTSGGLLAEEAAYGRVRALRALGRASEERAAIRAFLERFPDGAAAAGLRDRERALSGGP